MACRPSQVKFRYRIGYPSVVRVLIALLGGCTITGTPTVPLPFEAGGQGVNSPYQEQSPQIAGRYIVFSSERRGSQDIYLFDRTQQRLVDLPGLNRIDLMAKEPAISANGEWLVFVGSQQAQSDIFLYNRRTGQIRNLTTNLQESVRQPSISGTGEIIAFEASRRGQWDILVYNRLGQILPLDFTPR